MFDLEDENEDTPLEQAVTMFKYFWREKGDPTRWCGYDENKALLKEHRPELLKAWKDYVVAKRTLDRLTA